MKTIVEIMDGIVYVYRNTEKHFKNIRSQLNSDRLKKIDLDTECNISYRGDCYIVIDGDVNDTI